MKNFSVWVCILVYNAVSGAAEIITAAERFAEFFNERGFARTHSRIKQHRFFIADKFRQSFCNLRQFFKR